MSKALEQAKERIEEIVSVYGVKPLNLIIERHNLATEKRILFTIRFVEEDSAKEKEITEKMDELTEKIYNLDMKLYDYGINDKLRTQLLRDIKKVYPDDWFGGFGE